MIAKTYLSLVAVWLACGAGIGMALAEADAPAGPQQAKPTDAADKDEQAPEIDPAKVKGLIAQLSSDDFKVREKASEQLKQIGPAAEELITRAMRRQGASKELKHRCEQILRAYRIAKLPALLAKASLEGKAQLDKFTRHDKKKVYVGAHSMRGVYRFSPYYMLLKELAVAEGLVPDRSARATLRSSNVSWTLPVPYKNWPADAEKPEAAFIKARTGKLIQTGQRHERTRGRLYLQGLAEKGIQLPVPAAWKDKAKDDQKSKVRGRS
jgi:hypothetical protein